MFFMESFTDKVVIEEYDAKMASLEKIYPIKKLLDSIRPKGVTIEDIAVGASKLGGDVVISGSRYGIPTAYIFLSTKQEWLSVRGTLRSKGLSR